MKKLNFYFAAALVAAFSVFFSSCQPEPDRYREVIITFEDVELGENGYKNNFPDGLILGGVDFYNHFDDSQGWTFWYGFAVSNQTDRETQGFMNEFSVFATSGAGGSEQFAVVYCAGEWGSEAPNVRFLNNQEFEFRSLMVNNTTWAALAIRDGYGVANQFVNGDWFKLIITGFDARGRETGKEEFYLADFRGGRTTIVQEWTRIDLSRLGKVNRLEFTFASSDTGEWGINTPTYAAIDNIIYAVPL